MGNQVYIYDRYGRQLAVMEYVERICSDPDYSVIARDVVGDVEISTVWLGRPDLECSFETMAKIQGEEPAFYRYGNETEATWGHQHLVEDVCPASDRLPSLQEMMRALRTRREAREAAR